MNPRMFLTLGIMPALHLLPSKMDTEDAAALMLAIALQETGLNARRQIDNHDGLDNEPARSMFQFELGGVNGVLKHPASRELAQQLLASMAYADRSPAQLLVAMEFDQVLAATFARLALLRDPAPLPHRGDPQAGWLYYLRIWAPDMPREAEWSENWARAWAALG